MKKLNRAEYLEELIRLYSNAFVFDDEHKKQNAINIRKWQEELAELILLGDEVDEA